MPPGEHTPPSERTHGRLPLALFPELLDFPSDQVALEHAEVLQKKDSIQVVDLMAKGSRQQVFAANFELFTFRILRFDGHKLRAPPEPSNSGNRKASLFFANFTFGVNNFRIRQHDLGFGVFSSSDVNHGEPQALSDLRSGQSHALRRVHRGKHVLGQLLQFGVEFPYRRSRLFQVRSAIFPDGINFARTSGSLGGVGGGRGGSFRTRRFVWHSCQNSAAFPRASLLQIFAEKHPPAQVPPWLRRPRLRPAPRTNPTARRPP